MHKIKNISNKRISFDFDGTLEDDFDDTPNPQKEEIQNILKQLQSLGNEVYIVTKRYSPSNCNLGLTNEHLTVFETALKLQIPQKNIIFTNREYKADTLIGMSVDYHFENCNFEIDYLNTKKHNITSILIINSYWRNLIY